MKAKFTKSRITGLSVCVPHIHQNIDDLLPTVFQDNIKLLKRTKKITGLQYRYIADDTVTTTDLAYCASKNIISKLNIDIKTIDLLLFVTQTPDYHMPSCSSFLHGKLGLEQNTIAIDINHACAGFIYGLYTSFTFIENNNANRILLVVGDTLSKTVNNFDEKHGFTYGDGVSATIIDKTTQESNSFFSLYSDGSGYNKLIIPKGAFGKYDKETINNDDVFNTNEYRNLNNLYMDGSEIFNKALLNESNSIRDILQYANMNIDDIDYFYIHQSNKFLVESIANDLNIPMEKVPNDIITKYANLSACSIPALLCSNTSNYKALLTAFGAGYSWGSAIINIDKNFISDNIFVYGALNDD